MNIFRQSISFFLVFLLVATAPERGVVRAEEEADTDVVRYFHEHIKAVALNDETFKQAIGSRPKKSRSWLLFFHTTVAAQTPISGNAPEPSELAGLSLATINVEDGKETTKRLKVKKIPSFVCLRGKHIFHYDGELSWHELIAYCQNPPAREAKALPLQASPWEHFRSKFFRHKSLQVAAIVMVAGLGVMVAACVGHFWPIYTDDRRHMKRH